MAKKLRLRIVTPNRVMFDDDVDMVVMRAKEGDIGVLPGHSPLTTILSIGILHVTKGLSTFSAAVHSGFVEITPENVSIITDSAEWPYEIDIERSESSKHRAELRISEHADADDIDRAILSLRRAIVRMHVKELHGPDKIDESK